MGFDERVVNGMRVLAAIVDGGSFVRAGEQLGISPSGVSRAVARLETRLGIRLFDRTTRSLALTDEGRRFHARIMPLLAGLEEAASEAADGATAVRGRLRVHVDPFFSRSTLGPRLGAFLDQHPGLALELITRDQLGDIVADGFDLALRFGFPQSSSLVARKLFDTRIVTVAAPAYLARHGRPATPQALEHGHRCIQYRDPQTGRAFTWEFHRGEQSIVVPTGAPLLLNEVGTLHSVCLSGYGVAQTFSFGVAAWLANGQLVDLFPDWPDERFPLYALYPSRQHPSAKTRAFIDFVSSLA